MAFSTHTAIDQNLRHRIFGGRVFFFLISLVQSLNVVFRMVVADELESIGILLIVLRQVGCHLDWTPHDEIKRQLAHQGGVHIVRIITPSLELSL